jgi:16S rRNA (uracil1498-N3)-methyltransferase
VGGHHTDPMLTALVAPGMVNVGALLDLEPAEAHHLQVRRAASGEQVRLLDGRGSVGTGVLSLGRREARVEVISAERQPRPAELVLMVGAGDRDRFTWLAEKAAELGVTDLVPLETERTANVATRVRETHIEKLQLRALEAVKQSGAAWAPTIHPPATLSAVLASPRNLTALVAEQGSASLGPVTADEAVTCLVGPEGGWTDQERKALMDGGCRFIGLGPHTLRFETAALALAVLVQDHRARSRAAAESSNRRTAG